MIGPFDTFLVENREFNDADVKAECDRLFERQKAIQGLTEGTIDPEYLLDLLQEHDGIDATEYVDAVCENVDFLIRNG
jgi:hypothetical protein